jgi:hypothetical protein
MLEEWQKAPTPPFSSYKYDKSFSLTNTVSRHVTVTFSNPDDTTSIEEIEGVGSIGTTRQAKYEPKRERFESPNKRGTARRGHG